MSREFKVGDKVVPLTSPFSDESFLSYLKEFHNETFAKQFAKQGYCIVEYVNEEFLDLKVTDYSFGWVKKNVAFYKENKFESEE